MPYIIRTTWAFEGLGQGWSESFYWQTDSLNLNTAEAQVTPIAQKRAKLLAKGYELSVGRNTVVENVGIGKVKRVSDIFELRLPGVQAWEQPAEPNVALMLYKQTSTNEYNAKMYMRGVPNQLGNFGKKVDLNYASFNSSYESWKDAMIQFPTGWLVTAPTQTATIETYTTVAQSGIVSFVFGGAGFTWPVAMGKRTRIYVSLPGKSPLDGPLIVVPSDATHAMTAEPIGVAPQVPGQIGSAQIRTPTLVTLAPAGPGAPPGGISAQRMVSHKTGRPSYASRGRAPARTKW